MTALRLQPSATTLFLLITLVALRPVATQPPTQQDAPPSLRFSTYLGGSNLDAGQAVTMDAAGNVYVAGHTLSADLPVTSGVPYQGGLLGLDVYIAKFSPDGTLLWATYLGGTGDEMATTLAVDSEGRPYVGGGTTSADFPVTMNTLHDFQGGDRLGADGFLARLSADGMIIEYATYLGGTNDEALAALALDAEGRVYVAGATASEDFPTTPGTLQPAFAGGDVLRTDAFVARFRPDGTSLTLDYATYLGGAFDDKAAGLAADADGRAYVTGLTGSDDFPLHHPIQDTYAGPMRTLQGDAYVARLNDDGTALDFSTYFGGREDDEPTALALAPDGAVYITGWTQSPDFPATPGAVQTERRGPQDAFLARLEPAEADTWTLAYATYLGGAGTDQAFALAVDAGGQALVGGATYSDDFPMETPVQPAFGGHLDAFVALVSADGASLRQSTYLGGDGPDVLTALAVNQTDRVCTTGGTSSANYPTQHPLLGTPTGAPASPAFMESAFITCLGDAASGVATDEPLSVPTTFALHPNYPNPFNPATTLHFDVPRTARVRLAVYDLQGRRIATLIDGTHTPGRFAVPIDASGWPSGTYFARLDADAYHATQTITLVR